ncbi:AAA family ATPase [Anaerolineales bacterium HSG25]|nr:AAA family ATPase [Anaerolineales bacterium HSG25]
MLTKVNIKRYKSLYNVTIDLEPLTVLIGPNSTGKSNVCEALFVMSHLMKWRGKHSEETVAAEPSRILEGAARLTKYQNWMDKFWRRNTKYMAFSVSMKEGGIDLDYGIEFPSEAGPVPESILKAIDRVVPYHFSSALMSLEEKPTSLSPTGEGIANELAILKKEKPERFELLESLFIEMVPNVSKIKLNEQSKFHRTYYGLDLVDKYSNHPIPASDVSDGALRTLAFLTALYQVDTPSLVCFEELENGVHPWILYRMIEILTDAVTNGIDGKRVQVLLTTHSSVLLDYVTQKQIRVVELNQEGKTQIHALPIQIGRLQGLLEDFETPLGELWFSNVFGDNRSENQIVIGS